MAEPAAAELLAEPGEHLSTVTVDGVEHIVERVDDPARIRAIAAKIGSDDVLIADGHHRYGISRTFRDEVRARVGAGTPAEETLAFVGELVADQLSVEAIHRLYSGITFDALVAALDVTFERAPAGRPTTATLAEMNERGVLCLVGADGDSQWLTPRPDAFDGIRSLDGAWLEHSLGGVDHQVTYQHGVDLAVDAVTGTLPIRPKKPDSLDVDAIARNEEGTTGTIGDCGESNDGSYLRNIRSNCCGTS